MSTKGLTKEKIIAEAIAYIEESGSQRFLCMSLLADWVHTALKLSASAGEIEH